MKNNNKNLNNKNNDYKNYSFNDFDKYNCLKLSVSVYLILLFVLRGYLTWIMSVTNMRDRVSIIQFVYPDTSMFFLSLISGSLGLIVVILISLRRPNANDWVKSLWPYCRLILITALLFDLLINIVAFAYWQLMSMQWLLIQTTIVVALIVLCVRSKSLTINLQEFPEILEDDEKRKKDRQNKIDKTKNLKSQPDE